MSQTFQKARFFLLHSDVNAGKVERLESLHQEYVDYVRICVQAMFDGRRLSLARSEKQAFFPKADKLSSQIEKNARDHAIQIVSTWAKSRYTVKATLRRRYLAHRAERQVGRSSPARSLGVSPKPEPSPLGRSLTTGVCAKAQTGIGSNLVPSPA